FRLDAFEGCGGHARLIAENRPFHGPVRVGQTWEYLGNLLPWGFLVFDAITVTGCAVKANPLTLAGVGMVSFRVTVAHKAGRAGLTLFQLLAYSQEARNRSWLGIRVEHHIL